MDSNNKVCRLCLQVLGKSFISIDTVEHGSREKPFRKKLSLCLPEMALDITPNPVICFICAEALHAAYNFKIRCLEVEEQVRSYIRQVTAKVDCSDLIEIAATGVCEENNDPEALNEAEGDCQVMDDVMYEDSFADDCEETLQPPQPFSTVKLEAPDLQMEDERGSSSAQDEDPFLVVRDDDEENCKDESEDSRSFLCSVCGFHSVSIEELHVHMMLHNANQCGWCKRYFKSDSFLFRHQKKCSIRMKIERSQLSAGKEDGCPVTAKVPRLPRQAKYLLETWLYEHQNDPYPTDGEKMKMAEETNLTLIQVQNWFINARRRILKGNYCKKYYRKVSMKKEKC